jgi:hypothetical protein
MFVMPANAPFQIAEAVIVLLVENSPFVLAEINPAVGVAETEKAIGQKRAERRFSASLTSVSSKALAAIRL